MQIEINTQQNINQNQRVLEHDGLCSRIYKNKRGDIPKGSRCTREAIKSDYTKDENGNYQCRTCAQNKRSYRNVKVNNKKVGKNNKKKVSRIVASKNLESNSGNLRRSPRNKSKNNENTSVATEKLSNNIIEEIDVGVDIPQIENENDYERKQEDRFFISHLYSNCGATSCAAEKIVEELYNRGNLSIKPSRNTIIRAAGELAIISDLVFAEVLLKSENIGIGFDEASKDDGRSHLEVEVFGSFSEKYSSHWFHNLRKTHFESLLKISKKQEEKEKALNQAKNWSYVLCTQEITSKESEKIVETILKRFEEIFKLQKLMNTKENFSIASINYISGDWTIGNFGENGGCSKLLDEKRKIINPNCGDLLEVGCGDHSCHTIPKNFHKNIEKIIPNNKLNGYKLVKNLYKSVTGLDKMHFKGFLLENYPQKKK